MWVCWFIIEHMNVVPIEFTGDAVGRLRHSAQLRRQADIDEMQALSELAAEHSWSTEDEFDVTRERAVRLGADGSPLVGEFLTLEVAAVKGISVTAATWLVRDVVNLQSRHPVLWRCVCRGEVPPYRAFQLAQLAAKYELTQSQAHELDTALAPKLGTLGWARLMRLARGLIALIAAEAVKAAANRAREARFCRMAPADEPVVSELWARLDTPDAQQLDSTLSALAKALAGQGDTDSLDVRRAKALGILATPQRATALLGGSDDDRYLPRTRVFLHLADAAAGVARSETMGPIVKARLAELFGTHRITVTPVVHAGSEPAVDSYEIPKRMAESVRLRDICEIFPYSSRAARRLDHDHTIPYVEGVAQQTRPDNLGPLTRRVHRAKTACQWQVKQPKSGVFWWHSPRGEAYRVTPQGTTDLHDWSTGERVLQFHLDDRPFDERPPPT